MSSQCSGLQRTTAMYPAPSTASLSKLVPNRLTSISFPVTQLATLYSEPSTQVTLAIIVDGWRFIPPFWEKEKRLKRVDMESKQDSYLVLALHVVQASIGIADVVTNWSDALRQRNMRLRQGNQAQSVAVEQDELILILAAIARRLLAVKPREVSVDDVWVLASVVRRDGRNAFVVIIFI